MPDRPLRAKPLFYIDHAVDRMRERGFSDRDVRLILFTGDEAESSWQPKKGPHRYARQLVLRDKPAKVIFLDFPDSYRIITVEWVYEP